MRLLLNLAVWLAAGIVVAAIGQDVFGCSVVNSAAIVVMRTVSPQGQRLPAPPWPSDALWERMAGNRRWAWEGRRALARGDLGAAAASFEQAARSTPDHSVVGILLGDVYERMGRHADALAAWAQAGAFPRLIAVVEEALRAKRWEDGLAALNAASALHPGDAQVVAGWVAFYRARGDSEGAADVLRQAIAAHPDDAASMGCRLQLGSILEGQGRWAEAIALYRDVIRHAPAHVGAHVSLGLALYNGEHQLAEALAEMDRAELLAPGSSEPPMKKSQILRAERRYTEALAQAQRAAELEPDSIWPQVAQAQILRDMGQPSPAIALLLRTIEAHPEQAHPYYILAYAYRQNGEKEKALAAAERAVALDASNMGYRVTAARMREGMGDMPGAITAYESILALAPDNQDARQALARLRAAKENKP